jgi:hypothetical protein
MPFGAPFAVPGTEPPAGTPPRPLACRRFQSRSKCRDFTGSQWEPPESEEPGTPIWSHIDMNCARSTLGAMTVPKRR